MSIMEEKILIVLLINSTYNDSKRWFAGIRRPSGITREIMKDLCNLYESIAEENARAATLSE